MNKMYDEDGIDAAVKKEVIGIPERTLRIQADKPWDTPVSFSLAGLRVIAGSHMETPVWVTRGKEQVCGIIFHWEKQCYELCQPALTSAMGLAATIRAIQRVLSGKRIHYSETFRVRTVAREIGQLNLLEAINATKKIPDTTHWLSLEGKFLCGVKCCGSTFKLRRV